MTSNPDEMSREDLIKEVDRISILLKDCLSLNGCTTTPSVSAMFGIIMNEFLHQKLPWSIVEGYFKNVLDQAKPFFVKE